NNLAPAFNIYSTSFKDDAAPACAPLVVNWIPGGSHVEITCFATTDLASRRVIRQPQQNPNSPFAKASAAVWAGNTLYLSGRIGTMGGQLADGTEAQTHQLG